MTQQKIEEIPEKVISNIIHWINANLEEPLKIEDVSRRFWLLKMALAALVLKIHWRKLGKLYPNKEASLCSFGPYRNLGICDGYLSAVWL